MTMARRHAGEEYDAPTPGARRVAEGHPRTVEDIADDYRQFRGRCRELCDEARKADPSLRLVRGHYYCPIWNTEEPHWWCERQDGSIFDPTARQFPSNGMGAYVEFDGMVDCAECGKTLREEEARIEGRYAFCSTHCFARFVGVA